MTQHKVIINTINDEIVNKECKTLKEATEFLKTYFKDLPEFKEEKEDQPKEE